MSEKIPVLIVDQLFKLFSTKGNQFIAVDGISFNLYEGEILGLLGPNGAGKTTTVQMLLSTLTPTSGSIKILGKDLATQRSECLQHLGYASAYVNLTEHLTVLQNLNVYGRLYGFTGKELKYKIEKFLKLFNVWDQRNKEIKDLSAGQKTRVMLTKAFMTKPRIVLLDEPTASLDPDIAQQVRQFILDQRKEQNIAIIFTSHNMDEVNQICDRVLVMRKGKIIADDTPDNLVATITTCHLHLFIEKNMDKAVAFTKAKEFPCNVQEKWLEIEIEEDYIAHFLIDLAQQGISFEQIYIDRPKLEDYFISISKPKKK